MGRIEQQASGEQQDAAVFFAPVPWFSFTNTCLAQFHFPCCTLPTSLGISNKIDLAASLNFTQIPLEPGAGGGGGEKSVCVVAV